jgi:hypothetical protein
MAAMATDCHPALFNFFITFVLSLLRRHGMCRRAKYEKFSKTSFTSTPYRSLTRTRT